MFFINIIRRQFTTNRYIINKKLEKINRKSRRLWQVIDKNKNISIKLKDKKKNYDYNIEKYKIKQK